MSKNDGMALEDEVYSLVESMLENGKLPYSHPRDGQVQRATTNAPPALISATSLCGFRRILASLGEPGGAHECLAGRKESNLDMAISKSDALACSRGVADPIALEFISVSKHSNFENRTESAESRALEKNELFGEEGADSAD